MWLHLHHVDAVFGNLQRMVCAILGVPPLSSSSSISVDAMSGRSWEEHSCIFPLCGFCLAGLPVLTEICFSLIQGVMTNSSSPLLASSEWTWIIALSRVFHPQEALWPFSLNRVHKSFPHHCFLNILCLHYPVFKECHTHCHIIFTIMRNKMVMK